MQKNFNFQIDRSILGAVLEFYFTVPSDAGAEHAQKLNDL